MINKLLATHRIDNIVCFGLGDLARRPPGVMMPCHQVDNEPELQADDAEVHAAMMQHAAALTIAEEVNRHSRTSGPARLLAQDPQYASDTKEFLKAMGFEIVGDFGAGGFGEVDNQSIVFCAWVAAPVKQILADIARPSAIITLADSSSPINRLK